MGPARPQGEDGFTLIEVLVAFLILIVGLTGTFALVEAANGRSTANKGREGATNVAREISEQVRILPYTQLNPAELEPKVRERPGMADDDPGTAGWQINRRGFTYTVATSVCTIDDRADKFGDHSSGGFCADSTGVNTGDPAADDLKRVAVEVTFSDRGRTILTRSTSTINSVLQVSGVPITELALNRTDAASTITPSATEPVIGTAVDSLIFRVKATDLGGCTTTSTGCKVLWSVQGQLRQPQAVRINATEWEFTWTITGLSDGVYFVGAQAVEKTGDIGPIREIPVRLARSVPPAPTGLRGGYNTIYSSGTPTEVAELQWSASPRLNVKGYRVRRGNGSIACETTTISATSCIDFSPPAQTAPEADRKYSVVAIFYDAAGVQQVSAPAEVVLQPVTTTVNSTRTDYQDRQYRLLASTGNTGTNCLTTSSQRRDLVDGVDGAGYGFVGGINSITFCSPEFAAGDGVAGPVTFSAYFDNRLAGNSKKCNVTAALWKRGSAAVELSKATVNFVAGTADGQRAFALPDIPATTLAAGDRLNLTLSFDQNNCSDVVLYYGIYGGINFGGRLNLRTSSTVATTSTTNTRPDPPTNLRATPQADGTVLLQWDKPAGGPAVEFYRIYKGGQDYTSRLNTTGDGIAATEEYVVPGGAVDYYVTAVAPTMTESSFLGPVQP